MVDCFLTPALPLRAPFPNATVSILRQAKGSLNAALPPHWPSVSQSLHHLQIFSNHIKNFTVLWAWLIGIAINFCHQPSFPVYLSVKKGHGNWIFYWTMNWFRQSNAQFLTMFGITHRSTRLSQYSREHCVVVLECFHLGIMLHDVQSYKLLPLLVTQYATSKTLSFWFQLKSHLLRQTFLDPTV